MDERTEAFNALLCGLTDLYGGYVGRRLDDLCSEWTSQHLRLIVAGQILRAVTHKLLAQPPQDLMSAKPEIDKQIRLTVIGLWRRFAGEGAGS